MTGKNRTDIKLWPSRLEYYCDQPVKQLVRTRLISSCGQVNAVLPILFVSSYSYIIKLEQIHMQLYMLLNCHLATFFGMCDFKKWPNDNLITVACMFAAVSL